LNVDESGLSWIDKLITGAKNFSKAKVNKLLSSAIYSTAKSTKKIKVYDKDGLFEDAIKDFNNLSPKNVKIKHENGKRLYIGTLEDGRTVIARDGSHGISGNVPTLEIQAKNLKHKIRYTPKLPYNQGMGTGLGPIDVIIGAIIDGIFS